MSSEPVSRADLLRMEEDSGGHLNLLSEEERAAERARRDTNREPAPKISHQPVHDRIIGLLTLDEERELEPIAAKTPKSEWPKLAGLLALEEQSAGKLELLEDDERAAARLHQNYERERAEKKRLAAEVRDQGERFAAMSETTARKPTPTPTSTTTPKPKPTTSDPALFAACVTLLHDPYDREANAFIDAHYPEAAASIDRALRS